MVEKDDPDVLVPRLNLPCVLEPSQEKISLPRASSCFSDVSTGTPSSGKCSSSSINSRASSREDTGSRRGSLRKPCEHQVNSLASSREGSRAHSRASSRRGSMRSDSVRCWLPRPGHFRGRELRDEQPKLHSTENFLDVTAMSRAARQTYPQQCVSASTWIYWCAL